MSKAIYYKDGYGKGKPEAVILLPFDKEEVLRTKMWHVIRADETINLVPVNDVEIPPEGMYTFLFTYAERRARELSGEEREVER